VKPEAAASMKSGLLPELPRAWAAMPSAASTTQHLGWASGARGESQGDDGGRGQRKMNESSRVDFGFDFGTGGGGGGGNEARAKVEIEAEGSD
jgi:hypothetical protein